MKLSLNWLRDYVDIDLGAEELAEVLSDLGFPCEGIEQVGDDWVIDAEVTSNRGDCLGHIGFAREIAAATGRELRLPAVELAESEAQAGDLASVEIAEPELCGRYTARVIQGVKVGPSPDWVVRRLEAVGMRSVNNVVDATNYAMMETGQPPHAFDYDKIAEGRIVVRRAAAGERIVSIDGSKCDLDGGMLVITDPTGPVAIAGVMGGLHTEVGDETTAILLEDAHFDPVSVRTTSRKLVLPSEAAFRFKRIVDIEEIDRASKRTCQLIVEFAGGKVAKGVVDCYPKRWEQKEVRLRMGRLSGLLGVEIAADEAARILGSLSFEPRIEGDDVVCRVPSWRSDVYREVDLIEEVARVYGYGKIPTEKRIEIEVVPVDARQKLAMTVGGYLNCCGFYEAINVTFVDDKAAGLFAESEAAMAVRDESRKHANVLRQSLLGSLLGMLRTNVNAKNLPCRLYEIADTFVPSGEGDALPDERTKLGMVCDSDMRALRGAVEGLIGTLNRDAEVVFAPKQLSWAETGASIEVNGRAIGTAGIVSPGVLDTLEIKDTPAVAAEVYFDELASLRADAFEVKPIPRFPAVQRDLSIVVDEQVAWADIEAAVRACAPQEMETLRFVGIYRGKGVEGGKKSVTLTLCFRDADGTLTHETVDGWQKDIVGSLGEAVSAELRAV